MAVNAAIPAVIARNQEEPLVEIITRLARYFWLELIGVSERTKAMVYGSEWRH